MSSNYRQTSHPRQRPRLLFNEVLAFGSCVPWFTAIRYSIEREQNYPHDGADHGGHQKRAKRDVYRTSWLDNLTVSVLHGRKECITWLAA